MSLVAHSGALRLGVPTVPRMKTWLNTGHFVSITQSQLEGFLRDIPLSTSLSITGACSGHSIFNYYLGYEEGGETHLCGYADGSFDFSDEWTGEQKISKLSKCRSLECGTGEITPMTETITGFESRQFDITGSAFIGSVPAPPPCVAAATVTGAKIVASPSIDAPNILISRQAGQLKAAIWGFAGVGYDWITGEGPRYDGGDIVPARTQQITGFPKALYYTGNFDAYTGDNVGGDTGSESILAPAVPFLSAYIGYAVPEGFYTLGAEADAGSILGIPLKWRGLSYDATRADPGEDRATEDVAGAWGYIWGTSSGAIEGLTISD